MWVIENVRAQGLAGEWLLSVVVFESLATVVATTVHRFGLTSFVSAVVGERLSDWATGVTNELWGS